MDWDRYQVSLVFTGCLRIHPPTGNVLADVVHAETFRQQEQLLAYAHHRGEISPIDGVQFCSNGGRESTEKIPQEILVLRTEDTLSGATIGIDQTEELHRFVITGELGGDLISQQSTERVAG